LLLVQTNDVVAAASLDALLHKSTSPSDRKPRTPRGRSDWSAAGALRRPGQPPL
jgi:hypothetical protein